MSDMPLHLANQASFDEVEEQSLLCDHGDIPSACLDCLDGVPPPRPVAPKVKATSGWDGSSGRGYVVAQLEGLCPECREEVEVGDKIIETHPGSGRWGHLNCLA